MPAQCVKCGEQFDMRHDYARKEYESTNERAKTREMMCWDCRKSA